MFILKFDFPLSPFHCVGHILRHLIAELISKLTSTSIWCGKNMKFEKFIRQLDSYKCSQLVSLLMAIFNRHIYCWPGLYFSNENIYAAAEIWNRDLCSASSASYPLEDGGGFTVNWFYAPMLGLPCPLRA